jgi:hypothetical protein
MMSEFRTIEMRLVTEKILLFLSRDIFCIQYDRNTFVCLSGTTPKFYSKELLDTMKNAIEPQVKKINRIHALAGKRFLEDAVNKRMFFDCGRDFLKTYLSATGVKK